MSSSDEKRCLRHPGRYNVRLGSEVFQLFIPSRLSPPRERRVPQGGAYAMAMLEGLGRMHAVRPRDVGQRLADIAALERLGALVVRVLSLRPGYSQRRGRAEWFRESRGRR
jgi:hypothetical protein